MTTDYAGQARIRAKLGGVVDMKPSAVEECLDLWEAGKIKEATLADNIKELRESRSDMFFDAESQDLAQAAFVDGNLTARGKLSKTMPLAELDALAQSFGLKNAHDFGRGKVPDAASGGDKKKNGGDRDNPWRASHWNISRQGQLVKSLGTEAAARIAAAAGCKIGSTRPNPAY